MLSSSQSWVMRKTIPTSIGPSLDHPCATIALGFPSPDHAGSPLPVRSKHPGFPNPARAMANLCSSQASTRPPFAHSSSHQAIPFPQRCQAAVHSLRSEPPNDLLLRALTANFTVFVRLRSLSILKIDQLEEGIPRHRTLIYFYQTSGYCPSAGSSPPAMSRSHWLRHAEALRLSLHWPSKRQN